MFNDFHQILVRSKIIKTTFIIVYELALDRYLKNCQILGSFNK